MLLRLIALSLYFFFLHVADLTRLLEQKMEASKCLEIFARKMERDFGLSMAHGPLPKEHGYDQGWLRFPNFDVANHPCKSQ